MVQLRLRIKQRQLWQVAGARQTLTGEPSATAREGGVSNHTRYWLKSSRMLPASPFTPTPAHAPSFAVLQVQRQRQ